MADSLAMILFQDFKGHSRQLQRAMILFKEFKGHSRQLREFEVSEHHPRQASGPKRARTFLPCRPPASPLKAGDSVPRPLGGSKKQIP